jgi:hypothetical protein
MVGAAACWPVQSKRGMIAPARTAWQAPASTLGQARPSIGTSEGKGLGPLARPGAKGANIAEPYKGPGCSNGYRQRGRCDSRPDWHKLTVLISSAGHRDPHRRASGVHDPHRRGSVITISSACAGLITFRIGRAGHHDTYRRRVTVPDWHKCKRTMGQAYYGPPENWHRCKRTSPPTDKPSLWMGQPPISLAYIISPAYRSGLNDKFCLSVVHLYYYAGRRITAWTSLDTTLAGP